MVAVVLEIDNGFVVHAAVAVGACSAVARRLPSLEKKLLAQPAVSATNTIG
jgi:CO/xanthine dehydrogenase FAD-binding subunit